jgi:magnesium transporter
MNINNTEIPDLTPDNSDSYLRILVARVHEMKEDDAVNLLLPESDEFIARVLRFVVPNHVRDILHKFPEDRMDNILAAASPESRRQWARLEQYAETSVGSLMEVPLGVLPSGITIRAAVEKLRRLVKKAFITYGFVVDDQERLLGVVTMRELLFGNPEATIESIMLKKPFSLLPETEVVEAMKQVLHHHFPVYPVCMASGVLVGLVRGQTLFEKQAIELSAQPGSMVGVEKEEHLSTPLLKSLKFRHPWLQLNLLTAFVAATVVGIFQGTIDKLVVLAVFLPVLAGQSGNTGCQALAIALRGLTLGEFKSGKERRVIAKEGLLGLLNGSFVGVTAGIAMYIVAFLQNNPDALLLALVVILAMIFSCIISGIAGVLVPLALRKFGADPVTASSIFLTTATDVASMGIFLWLATWLVL